MASPFETEGTILTQEQANHINERHVFVTKHVRTSKFWLRFNLSDMLKDLSERTWERDSDVVVLLEEGGNKGTGIFICMCSQSTSKLALIRKTFPRVISPFITPKKYQARNGK